MKTITNFAPVLYLPNGITNIDFYKKAFNAVENFRFTNDDGSLHVAELVVDGAVFHVHEQNHERGTYTPLEKVGTAVVIGLFVDDVHALFNQAVAAGAIVRTPVTDYDYGYRQGDLIYPFGHIWTLQKKLK